MLEVNNDGYVVIKSLISPQSAYALSSNIKSIINDFATELNVSTSRYLYCTGRWANPSPITKTISETFNVNIQQKLNEYYNQNFTLRKTNIIVKSKDIKDEVPFHQDISYSYDSPYNLSVWLSLNDIDTDNGPMQVIPGSHKWPIASAVDFWSSNFVDNIRMNYADSIKEIYLEAGDAIIFDSRLWHGSKRKLSFKDRFAYVSRWVSINDVFPYIPPPIPSFYGMWTADQVAYDMLSSNLNNFIKYFSSKQQLENLEYSMLIEKWKEVLSHIDNEGIDSTQAITALDNLLILKEASFKHSAGDLAGKIYKNLWDSLLKLLPFNNFSKYR
jgi:hypothetical protein